MSKHRPNCKCSLCGCSRYETFTFKQGYICDRCLAFLKEGYDTGQIR